MALTSRKTLPRPYYKYPPLHIPQQLSVSPSSLPLQSLELIQLRRALYVV
jgi:hypothetical protein